VQACAYLNLGLSVVNLIPAFPLDGGKLVHLVVEERWGRVTPPLLWAGSVLYSPASARSC
jgi:membrane-associated protease RseP (regulator of RpoE activity)